MKSFRLYFPKEQQRSWLAALKVGLVGGLSLYLVAFFLTILARKLTPLFYNDTIFALLNLQYLPLEKQQQAVDLFVFNFISFRGFVLFLPAIISGIIIYFFAPKKTFKYKILYSLLSLMFIAIFWLIPFIPGGQVGGAINILISIAVYAAWLLVPQITSLIILGMYISEYWGKNKAIFALLTIVPFALAVYVFHPKDRYDSYLNNLEYQSEASPLPQAVQVDQSILNEIKNELLIPFCQQGGEEDYDQDEVVFTSRFNKRTGGYFVEQFGLDFSKTTKPPIIRIHQHLFPVEIRQDCQSLITLSKDDSYKKIEKLVYWRSPNAPVVEYTWVWSTHVEKIVLSKKEGNWKIEDIILPKE